MISLSDYDYFLPSELIAQEPANPPESAKCLHWNWETYSDKHVKDLWSMLDPNTLIIFNNTKVVKARIPLFSAKRMTSLGKQSIIQKWEIFFLEHSGSQQYEALVNPWKKFQIGDYISQDNRSMKVIAITEYGRILECSHDINDILEQYWQIPLPPYIQYKEALTHRYQSVVAEKHGSVASATASLHFSPSLLKKLHNQGHNITTLTLHIGLWTFKIVSSDDIRDHPIHSENIFITFELREKIANTKSLKKPILAIGTTVVRTLESMLYIRKIIREKIYSFQHNRKKSTIDYRDQKSLDLDLYEAQKYISNIQIEETFISCATKIFLYPSKKCIIVDQLLTNFHLPKSSLLMLVASFIGYSNMMVLYNHAIQHRYRFFSFWDCMFLSSKQEE